MAKKKKEVVVVYGVGYIGLQVEQVLHPITAVDKYIIEGLLPQTVKSDQHQ